MRKGIVKIVINIIQDPCNRRNKGIVLIEEFLNSVGVSGENLIFVWGNKMPSFYEDFPESKVKLTSGILPLQQQAHSIRHYPITTSLGYISDFVRESDLDPTKYRTKRFLCFNRTMKAHRDVLAHFALKHNL